MKKENVTIKGRAYYQGLKSKYLNLAKESSASGDRVLSEYNLQFAEHYGRIISERFSHSPQPQRESQSKQPDKHPNPSEQKTQDTDTIKDVVLENKTRCIRKKPAKKEQIQEKVETIS